MARIALRKIVRQLVENGKWTDEDAEIALEREEKPKRNTTALDRVSSAPTSVPFFAALDAMMSESWDNFVRLREVATSIPIEEQDLRDNRTTLNRYDQERDRITRIAKDAIAAGVDERRVRIAEAEADKVLSVLAHAIEAAQLTPEQDEQLRESVAEGLREIGPGA